MQAVSDSDPGGDPAPAPAPRPVGADLDRRRFFRQFASEVLHTAATVVGAASALQRDTAQAANAILNGPRTDDVGVAPESGTPSPPAGLGPGAGTSAAAATPAATISAAGDRTAPPASTFGRPRPPVGYHSAFRLDGDRIVLIDQRRLPFALVDVDCRTAIEVANAISDRVLVGPAVAQAAALGLAASADRIRGSRP